MEEKVSGNHQQNLIFYNEKIAVFPVSKNICTQKRIDFLLLPEKKLNCWWLVSKEFPKLFCIIGPESTGKQYNDGKMSYDQGKQPERY